MKSFTIDEALTEAGEFGTYQIFLCSLLCFVGIASALTSMSYVFWAARVDHHCQIPEILGDNFQNISFALLKDFSIPWDVESSSYSKCEIYDRDYTNVTIEEILHSTTYSVPGNGSFTRDFPTKICNAWNYDTSQYHSTVVTQWDLVCDRAWLASASQSAFLGGMMVGGFVGGIISDRFGRRPALIISSIGQAVVGILLAFVSNTYLFIAGRCLVSAFSFSMYMTAFIIMLETIGSSWREMITNIYMVFWGLGYLVIAGMAFGMRDHFHLLLAVSIPTAICFFFVIVPESPRWLLANGNAKACTLSLKRIARWNQRILPEEFQVTLSKGDDGDKASLKTAVLLLIKSKIMVKRALIVVFLWVSTTIVYYGLSLNTSNLGGNDYVNFAISGGVEIFAYLSCWAILKHLGRRLPMASILVLCGIALFSIAPIPPEKYTYVVTLAMLGKFAITVAFSIIYVYSAEIFPTMTRVVAIGLCNIMARIAGIFTPYIADLALYNRIIPMILMGSVSVTAGILTLFLPETQNQPLPKTVEAAEQLGADQSFCGCAKPGSMSDIDSFDEKENNHNDVPEEAIGLTAKDPNCHNESGGNGILA